ncbi:MAG: lysylphosphatidylglycerol synthase transmembrane domain-containing protein [Immundisolibacter sp.]|uniref:lysylphosphatidylglycerol synthase transmembrane domain-containing protein n=1 Tax=Immundisolibacter sp. TaxID=1934948 RepID=UPI003EE1474F
MRRALLIAIFALALSAVIPLFIGGTALFPQLAALPLHVWVLALGSVAVGWNFNAMRLRLVLGGLGRSLGYPRAVATVLAIEFSTNATPAGSGGLLAYVYLLSRRGVTSSQAAAMYALDQVLDLSFFLTALLVLSPLVLLGPNEMHLGWQLGTLLSLLLGGAMLLWLTARDYRRVLLLAGHALRHLRISVARRRQLARWILRFRTGVSLLLGLARWRLGLMYLLCMGHWLLRYSVLYWVLRGLGQPMQWSYLFLTQMVSFGAGQVTLLPGGTGGVELGFSALLAPWLPVTTLAAALVAWRFATYYWNLLAGSLPFALLVGRHLWQTPPSS